MGRLLLAPGTMNETSIDEPSVMAAGEVFRRHHGVPPSTAEAFVLLERAGMIEGALAAALGGVVGFRNVAVQHYEDLDMRVLRSIVESGHRDWIRLGDARGVSIRP